MADFKRPCLKPLGVQLRASMPALEKGCGSVARSSRANYGGDCFPLAQSLRCYPLTFKMVRFCCSVKPSQLWWGLLHIRTINEIYRTIPCFAPSPLPPLSKGGGLTARHKPLYCCFLLVPRPPFLFTKPFCRQDGGIASPPLLRTTFLPPLVKGEVLSPEKIRATTGGIVTLTFAPHPTLPKPHYPTRFSWCECNSPTYRKNKIRPRFHGGELIKSLIYKY